MEATTKWIALLLAFMEASGLKIEDVESLIDEFGEYCKGKEEADKEYELIKRFFDFIKFIHDDIAD